MANIINGTDTGSGGLITTGDSSDELQLQTAETARVTLTNTAVVVNEDGNDVDFRVESDTVENALFVDGASGNVGIGTADPSGDGWTSYNNLVVSGTGSSGITIKSGASSAGGLAFNDAAGGIRGSVAYDHNGDYLAFVSAGGERMRIDSSGNLLVGLTTANLANAGHTLFASGTTFHATNGSPVLYLNRNTSDGTIVEIRKDNTTVGTIGTNGGQFFVGGAVAGYTGWRFADPSVLPMRSGVIADNIVDLGSASYRMDDIYATNAIIQTSDRNEKQDIEALSEAEARVAVAAKGLLKKYRWKSAVAEKGDDARIHFGIIAQDLKAAFEAEGLDAGRYAMFIHSAWWEHEVEVPAVEAKEAVYETQTDEEGNETQVLVSEAVEGKEAYTRTDTYQTEAEAPEGAVRKERMGIRYNELLAFIIAAI